MDPARLILVLAIALGGCRGDEVQAASDGAVGIDALGNDAANDAANDAKDDVTTPDTWSDAWPPGAVVASPGCGTRPGPKMVRVETLGDGGVVAFCVDTTEVTNEQYQHFLTWAASAAKPSLPSYCAVNAWPAPVIDLTRRKRPRVDVDWCDAWAYCAWAGKRLCGAIGGGHASYYDWLRGDVSQWSFACGNGAADTKFPYGSAELADACVTKASEPVDVASFDKCRGKTAPFDQIYDMVGNAGEWEDACSAYEGTGPDTRVCKVRGGWTPNTGQTCDDEHESSADFAAGDLSFRCCVDL
ncbi:MAG: SUMF1/EgtB/PvdO family nonheme iron enzyme [Deltaproteobacteria bacterium]|nr:SUMF1/EgtB/PvdO family nonheme iron enzyme [Deltaproteobacteria bacterium]